MPQVPGPARPVAPAPQGAPGAATIVDTPVRPPVHRARRRGRHVVVLLTFLIFVGLPAAVTGWYLWGVAADQFASKVGFSVRNEETSPSIELLSGLGDLGGNSSSDTDILYEFIQSQRLVSEVDDKLNLRALWSKPLGESGAFDWTSLQTTPVDTVRALSQDPVFALPRDASLEELVNYWNRMVQISYTSGSGLLEVTVLAFAPEDARQISQALFEESSAMINRLSDIAREDAIGYARDELDTALERLKAARATVTRFRNENQLINPEIDLQNQAGLLGSLQAQQAETIIELDLLADSALTGDPRLAQAQRKLEVIEDRIEAERKKLGFQGQQGDGDRVFADIVGEYERLIVEREFAEQAYVTALAAFDGAQAEARRQSRYLAAYMEPTLAETAQYPKRLIFFSLITLFLFLIWAILVMVAYSIKDRR